VNPDGPLAAINSSAARIRACFFYGAFQPHLDQMQHASINNPARYRF
jgi:hypothetical protein